MLTSEYSSHQFLWFARDTIKAFPQWYLIIGFVMLFLVLGIPLQKVIKGRIHFDRYGLMLYGILVTITAGYFRLPFLFLSEVNPDESHEISAAMALIVDPVYWRSVDLQTHGPLS